jgi:hypothetical protein
LRRKLTDCRSDAKPLTLALSIKGESDRVRG